MCSNKCCSIQTTCKQYDSAKEDFNQYLAEGCKNGYRARTTCIYWCAAENKCHNGNVKEIL